MIEHNVQQRTIEWARLHLSRPTASEFKRIIQAKSGKLSKGIELYIDQLVGDSLHMADGRYPPRIEHYMTRPMEHGIEREPEAMAWYEMETGNRIREVGFVTTDDGRFGWSPDGMIDPDGAIEIKVPEAKTQMRRIREGILPPEYKSQCHGALVVSGRKWIDFLSYCHGCPQFLIRVIPDSFTDELRVRLEDFHQRLMERIKSLQCRTDLVK